MINKKHITVFFLLTVICINLMTGCTVLDNFAIKMNFRNNNFDYIKNNKVNKIIIQNARDSGFKFIVNDSKAIDDIYEIIRKGKVVETHSDLEPDYTFEIWVDDEKDTYNYIVGEDKVGNFYNDSKNFIIPKTLEKTIMQNLSFIRKPRDFNYVYYQSILDVMTLYKDYLKEDNSVGIDVNSDTDCLKYIFSKDLLDFEETLKNRSFNAEFIKDDSKQYDTIITIKNRGYSTSVFKTLITIDDSKNKSYQNYYIEAEYNYKDWDIKVSEPNKKPKDW